MGFKEISPLEAMNALADGRPVYRFSQMSQELLAKTSVSGVLNLRFAVDDMVDPEEDTPEPKKKARKKAEAGETRKAIDWEKAEALAAAGWPNKAIAEELGTTGASIAAGFHRRKKRAEMKKVRQQDAEATERSPHESGPDTAADGGEARN